MNIAIIMLGYVAAPRPADMVYAPIDIAITVVEVLARRGHPVDFYGPLSTEFRQPREWVLTQCTSTGA